MLCRENESIREVELYCHLGLGLISRWRLYIKQRCAFKFKDLKNVAFETNYLRDMYIHLSKHIYF